ncbi:MAG: hypothetical protein INQ03_25680 [Candidatus Heimdallarchaeota archaeon]|nr:hypothetical protein [Candidatus Heimdallarchaeota archaeon]
MSIIHTTESTSTDERYEKCMYCAERANKWLISYNRPVCSIRHYLRAYHKILGLITLFFSTLTYVFYRVESLIPTFVVISLFFLSLGIAGTMIARYESVNDKYQKTQQVNKERMRMYNQYLLNKK